MSKHGEARLYLQWALEKHGSVSHGDIQREMHAIVNAQNALLLMAEWLDESFLATFTDNERAIINEILGRPKDHAVGVQMGRK